MYKIFYRATLIVGIVTCLCTSAGAIERDSTEATYNCAVVETDTIMRATGFFEEIRTFFWRKERLFEFMRPIRHKMCAWTLAS